MFNPPAVSVIICAYTEDRWSLLVDCVASVDIQTRPPIEIILCIDHNDELLQKCKEHFGIRRRADAIALTIVANKYDGRLGSARNSAAEIADGEILAFLDDDATAAPDWLECLIAPYEDSRVSAVGGAPLPVFEMRRPRWFPDEFDWVFGCAYSGLPSSRARLAHLIGANMSVRTSALREIGGFHSDNHDDMDMCHRLAFARHTVLYEPLAVVNHFVPASRTTWSYFWRRCYFVNVGKVEAFANMRGAANLGAELAFVGGIMVGAVPKALSQAVRGDWYAPLRMGAMFAGILLAGIGHLSGKARLLRLHRMHSTP